MNVAAAAARVSDFAALPLVGKVLLEASAGTGKTWQIAALYLRLILEAGAEVGQILVCTFTDAAAIELRGRIRTRLREAEDWLHAPAPRHADPLARWLACCIDADVRALWLSRLRLARLSFDSAPVGTIHSFCRRVLAEVPFASGGSFRAAELVAEDALLDEVYADFRRAILQAPAAERPAWASALLDGSQIRRGLGLLHNNPDAVRIMPPELESADGRSSGSPLTPLRPREAFSEAQWQALGKLVSGGLHPQRVITRQLEALLAGKVLSPQDWSRITPAALKLACRRPLEPRTWDALLAPLWALASAPPAPAPSAAGETCVRRMAARALAAADRWCAGMLATRLRAAGQLSFSALIDRVHAALAHGDALARTLGQRHPHILIDEFQDTDQRQFAIFSRLHGAASAVHPQRASLHLVGDPKQAIYGFRGGDIAAYQQAASQPDLARWSLDENQRSSAPLIAALNAVYGACPDGGFADPLIRHTAVRCGGKVDERPLTLAGMPVSRALQILVDEGEPATLAELERRALADCAQRIADLLSDQAYRIGAEPLRARDIAVLLHTNQQVQDLRAQLSCRGVPCVGAGRASVLDADCAAELELLLHALLEPGDEAALRGALGTRLLGFDSVSLRLLGEQRAAFEGQARRLDGWRRRFHGAGALAVVESVLDERAAALLAEPDGERMVTDLRHLGELLQALGARCQGPRQLLAQFRRLRRADTTRSEDHQQRLESDAGRVQLKTLHGSKGLQFPLVFLPLAWRPRGTTGDALLARFHDQHQRLCFDLGGPAFEQHRVLAEAETRAEQLRLLYVGLTRAEHAVWAHFSDRYTRQPRGTPGALTLLLESIGAGAGARAGLTRLGGLPAPLAIRSVAPRSFARVQTGPADRPARPIAPAPPLPEVRPHYAVHSFSRLTQQGVGLVGETQAAVDESLLESATPQPAVLSAELAHPLLLALQDLRGPRFGNAAHGVLEKAEVGVPIWPTQARLVTQQLRARGFTALDAADPRAVALGQMLERARLADLGGQRSLAALGSHDQVREFEFHLPLGGVSATRLRTLAQRHGWPELIPAGLQAGHLRGLLTGFVDLVACWQGRYYVVDYKTNWLGEALSAYRPVALQTAVAAAHYDLQALLYTVALHRYLRQQLPDYAPATHLGGVLLLFLRALGLDVDAGRCEWRFDDALIAAVDTALDSPEPVRMGASA